MAAAQEAGRKYINVASQLLNGTRADRMDAGGVPLERQVTIVNQRGLHARAAAKFVQARPRLRLPGCR